MAELNPLTDRVAQPPHAAAAAQSHHDRPYRRLVLAQDLVTDQALEDAGGDEFHHAAIAKGVADLALSSVTPVNVALFGPWGSGKSTLYRLMKKRIEQQDQGVQVAYYDAWKYGGQELKRNFIQEIARGVQLRNTSDLDRELTLNQEQTRIRLGRWFKYNKGSIAAAVLIAFVVAGVWTSAHAGLERRWLSPEAEFWDLFLSHINEFGLVLAGVLTALLLGPKALESAVVKTTRPAIERDDQFAQMFTKLVERTKRETGAHRLVFFIDELDRCQPDDVVATLVDLKTFLDEPDCVFVVAADREVLEHALRNVPQSKPVRDDDPYYSTPGAFIDKIFQHQIALPPLRHHALSSFAHGLVDDRPSGLWHDLREADPTGRLFDDVVYVLVPAHVSSPRRVKVLLNNFATNARIAESRHIDWVTRARELAVLTALETEFPTVAAALIRFPQLLTYIRGDKDSDEDPDLIPERKQILAEFDPAKVKLETESVAGQILRDREEDDRSDDKRELRAKAELAHQLRQYLEKLKVVNGLDDPRPDLLYLRVIGYDEGLKDPALGEMLDMAPDRQPDKVVAAFSGQPAFIRTLAVKLLLQSLATSRGTGQANVLESACRLAAEIPNECVAQVAYLAPEIINQVGKSSWRKAAVPGAVFLVASQPEAASHLTAILSDLDLTNTDDIALLSGCVPALAWAADNTAQPLHEAIATSLASSAEPLIVAMTTLPPAPAGRAQEAAESAVATRYESGAASTRVELFEALLQASLDSSDPGPLLWKALLQAQNSRQVELIDTIHSRRDEFMHILTAEHRTCVALYQVEIGPSSDWSDWVEHIRGTDRPVTEMMTNWARDAALAVVRKLPASTDDLSSLFTPILDLVLEGRRQEVHEEAINQVASVPWGEPADPDGFRWRNLREVALQVAADEVGLTTFNKAVADAIEASVASILPRITPTTIPDATIQDWRSQIAELPKQLASELDTVFSGMVAPNPAASVVLLRLRIAAHRVTRRGYLTPATLLAVAGEPSVAAMAEEWLALTPRVEQVLKVHESIPFSVSAMGRYAAVLTIERRSVLWIALEKAGATSDYLGVVGLKGLNGLAIKHMWPAIVDSSTQTERNEATDRLLTATFIEPPTQAEQNRGETEGHKEATSLALKLVDTKIYDNIVLAARVVIRSGGVAHGARGKLRSAFTTFANGSQSRNFTRDQAKALSAMSLLDAKKKGRMAWLFDLLN